MSLQLGVMVLVPVYQTVWYDIPQYSNLDKSIEKKIFTCLYKEVTVTFRRIWCKHNLQHVINEAIEYESNL